MATNTVQTPFPVTMTQSEKLVIEVHDRVLGEEIAAGLNDENSIDFTLTSAQILALTQSSSTSLMVMNPPARIPTIGNPTTNVTTTNTNPGYAIVLQSVIAYYKATATPYTVNAAGLSFVYDGGAELCRLPCTGLLDQTVDKMAVAGLVSPAAVGPLVLPNVGIRLVALTATPTVGTGTLSLRMYYTLVPANF